MKTTGTISLLSILLLGCTPNLYQSKLVPDSRMRTYTSLYGSYVETDTHLGEASGELIALTDTLYLMTQTGLLSLPASEIRQLTVHPVANRGRKKMVTALITVIPAALGAVWYAGEWSGGFLAVGYATLLPAITAAAIEIGRKPTTLRYPDTESDLTYFTKYARYPAGWPIGVTPADIQPAFE